MKLKKTDVGLFFGLIVILGPWLLDFWPGDWWYGIILLGCILIAIGGYGAQMAQLGKGDTGEELLEEVWAAIKKKSLKIREFFSSKNNL